MMPDIISAEVFLYFASILFAAIVIRYFIAAGIFYWYFYHFKSERWKLRRLNSKKSSTQQYRMEVFWSILSSMVFAIIGAAGIWLYQNDYTAIYTDPSAYGYWFLPVSLILAMLIHETYYYWVHRWMHHPRVFKIIHKVHHNSLVTSPWTAFSFHPLEAFIEALIIPAILMVIPMHPVVLATYLLIMTISSIINHLDIEIYPAGFKDHSFGKLFIGATHHHFHHKEFKSNYGLYFTFWDRWMDTESREYSNDT